MQESNQQYFFQSPQLNVLNTSLFDSQDSFMKEQGNSTGIEEPKIKKRIVETPNLNEKLQRNANMPKTIILNFSKIMPEFKDIYPCQEYFNQTYQYIQYLTSNNYDMVTFHLEKLFGNSREATRKRNYYNRKVLKRIIEQRMMRFIDSKSKVENSVSYIVCVEKYSYRLVNGNLTDRVQSR